MPAFFRNALKARASLCSSLNHCIKPRSRLSLYAVVPLVALLTLGAIYHANQRPTGRLDDDGGAQPSRYDVHPAADYF